MARRHTEQVAIFCPNGDYADRGTPGTPCPICGALMIEDEALVEEKSDVRVPGGEDLDSDLTKVPLDLDDPRETSGVYESLEEIAEDERNQGEDDYS